MICPSCNSELKSENDILLDAEGKCPFCGNQVLDMCSEKEITISEVLYEFEQAEHGDPVAQYGLGFMYHKGRGVPQDNKIAVKWYRKSAEQGLARGQYSLGFMYLKGKGVQKDSKEALVWPD